MSSIYMTALLTERDIATKVQMHLDPKRLLCGDAKDAEVPLRASLLSTAQNHSFGFFSGFGSWLDSCE